MRDPSSPLFLGAGAWVRGLGNEPRYIEAITKNPDLETSFVMMESFGMSLTLKKR